MYVFVIGTCQTSGITSVEKKKLTLPNWKLYQDNVAYRQQNKGER